MGQGPKVGWNGSGAAARYSGCWVSGRWQRRWLAGVARKKRGPSRHCLPKWALFKLLPIRCGVPGPDQARSLQHPTVQPPSHARTTKCRGLSENEHKLESDGGLGGIGDICQRQTSLTTVWTKLKETILSSNKHSTTKNTHNLSLILYGHVHGQTQKISSTIFLFISTDWCSTKLSFSLKLCESSKKRQILHINKLWTKTIGKLKTRVCNRCIFIFSLLNVSTMQNNRCESHKQVNRL